MGSENLDSEGFSCLVASGSFGLALSDLGMSCIVLAGKAIIDYFLFLQSYSNCFAGHPEYFTVLAEALF